MCACLFLLALDGCGAQIPDMSEEERKAISEYAANLLLKYDTSQPSRLVEIVEEETESTPEPTQTPEPVETAKPEETKAPEETDALLPQETEEPEAYDLPEDTLRLPEGVTLICSKYETSNIFVDETDGYQTLEAGEGKILLITRFVLLNSSNTVQTIDMLQDNIVYKVIVDDEVVNGMVTMVGNDLTTYIGSLQPDESKEVILFAEVEEALLQGCENIAVEFVRQDLVSKMIVK